MEKTVRVKIEKCSNPYWWYDGMITREFAAVITDEYPKDYKVCDGHYDGHFILKSDCSIVPEQDPKYASAEEYADSKVMRAFASEWQKLKAAFIAGQESDKWISVEDGLPENSDTVLVSSPPPYECYMAYLVDGNVWYDYYGCPVEETITHWQPLPPLPNSPSKKVYERNKDNSR